MKIPKLKHARLCRILTYVTVLGLFLVPPMIVLNIRGISDNAKGVTFFAFLVGLIVYVLKNLFNLMMLDEELAQFQCYQTARTQFELPDGFCVSDVEQRLSAFGEECSCASTLPHPSMLRYQFNRSLLIYAKGTEKVVCTYHTDLLNARTYQAIFLSANANSNVLRGRKQPKFLDRSQRDASLNRVTVPIIFASRVDDSFKKILYKTLCDQEKDGFELSFLPCIIDLERNICIFSSERIAYIGLSYPVKNRGVRIIKKYVFGGNLPLKGNPHMLEKRRDIDPEQSLWSFWRKINREGKEIDEAIEEVEHRLETMSSGQIQFENPVLYIKFDERGIEAFVMLNEETKKAEISPICLWDYPKANLISKKDISEIQRMVADYFSNLGYSCEFQSREQ